eukprot:MONOS_2190.1-p1 / transcript=MONOS_2190.1 / gene=MONOS_2190 / organism=Monocercomonoides_exilis_PA203 / gene_product=unspecified product / transcript_product=unspecified product / location=Mono_scaffold00043:117097-120682(+) / protein_length=1076 / sequence_SO=supercontig / SO=protein_coding / is_pseudo=false
MTLKYFEAERPRTKSSISTRKELCDELSITREMKQNKVKPHPFLTILEVLLETFLVKRTESQNNFSVKQSSVDKKYNSTSSLRSSSPSPSGYSYNTSESSPALRRTPKRLSSTKVQSFSQSLSITPTQVYYSQSSNEEADTASIGVTQALPPISSIPSIMTTPRLTATYAPSTDSVSSSLSYKSMTRRNDFEQKLPLKKTEKKGNKGKKTKDEQGTRETTCRKVREMKESRNEESDEESNEEDEEVRRIRAKQATSARIALNSSEDFVQPPLIPSYPSFAGRPDDIDSSSEEADREIAQIRRNASSLGGARGNDNRLEARSQYCGGEHMSGTREEREGGKEKEAKYCSGNSEEEGREKERYPDSGSDSYDEMLPPRNELGRGSSKALIITQLHWTDRTPTAMGKRIRTGKKRKNDRKKKNAHSKTNKETEEDENQQHVPEASSSDESSDVYEADDEDDTDSRASEEEYKSSQMKSSSKGALSSDESSEGDSAVCKSSLLEGGRKIFHKPPKGVPNEHIETAQQMQASGRMSSMKRIRVGNERERCSSGIGFYNDNRKREEGNFVEVDMDDDDDYGVNDERYASSLFHQPELGRTRSHDLSFIDRQSSTGRPPTSASRLGIRTMSSLGFSTSPTATSATSSMLLPAHTLQRIQQLLFGRIRSAFPASWMQGFVFDSPDGPYSFCLVQETEGASDVMAAVQAHLVYFAFHDEEGIEERMSKTRKQTGGFSVPDNLLIPSPQATSPSSTSPAAMTLSSHQTSSSSLSSSSSSSDSLSSFTHPHHQPGSPPLFMASHQPQAHFTEEEQTNMLVVSLASILWRCGREESAVVVSLTAPCSPSAGFPSAGTVKATKVESRDMLRRVLAATVFSYKGPWGVCLLMLSIVLSHGVDEVEREMQMRGRAGRGGGEEEEERGREEVMALVTGEERASDGLMGLMLVGEASLDEEEGRAEIGMMSVREVDGVHLLPPPLKFPFNPIWVLQMETHSGILFSYKPIHLLNVLHAKRDVSSYSMMCSIYTPSLVFYNTLVPLNTFTSFSIDISYPPSVSSPTPASTPKSSLERVILTTFKDAKFHFNDKL